VDGRLRASTGIVTPKELPRLLVVDNLQGAKEIKFVSRREGGENDSEMTVWGDPKFYRKK
jgi:hypothetical protein